MVVESCSACGGTDVNDVDCGVSVNEVRRLASTSEFSDPSYIRAEQSGYVSVAIHQKLASVCNVVLDIVIQLQLLLFHLCTQLSTLVLQLNVIRGKEGHISHFLRL